jgi:beta-lactamase regulating signal transducer with metallopeptidase domain
MSQTIVEVALKVSMLIALAAVAAGLMRRRASAASRHLVWTLAVVGVLVLPIASLVIPAWTIPIRRAAAVSLDPQPLARSSAATEDAATEDATTGAGEPDEDPLPAVTSISSMAFLAGAYAGGAALLLIRLGAEQWKMRQLVSRATNVTDPAWTELLGNCSAATGIRRAVRLVRTREYAMPMACGLRRPIVVIPSVAETWDDDRRRAVLLHELAHVARFDCLTQMLAEIAVALYWAHPGAWWIARRLRIERELACDDCVLSAGTDPRVYAGQLLELAYSLGGYRAPALVVSMARPRQLEGRMLAILDATRNRATVAANGQLLALTIAAVITGPLATATTVAHPIASAGQAAPAPAGAQADAAERSQHPGSWEIRPSETAGRLELTLNGEDHSFYGTTVPIERLEGITPALLSGGGGLVTFNLRRDAGTFTFEGVLKAGVGGGTYDFAASTTFPEALAKRGFARPSPAAQYALALADVGFVFLDELSAQKYTRPDLAHLVNAAQHGVSADYVRQMGQLGYRLGSVDALIRQRDHGVSPLFIRELRTQGLEGLSADDLVRARDHGVNPEYVSELRTLGYERLTLDELVGARDHGISPDYVRDLRPLGYQLSLADLTRARDHGVGVEYIKELAGLGYERMALDDLVRLRDHGVSPDWLRKVKRGSTAHLSVDELVSLRDHGVDSPEAVHGPELHSWNLRAKLDALFARWMK